MCHSKKAVSIAVKAGWLPGANYKNLRNVREFKRLGFLDIDWKNYNFNQHLEATKATCPILTVARDVMSINEFEQIMREAFELSKWAEQVMVVPKDVKLEKHLPNIIPSDFLLGYSMPTNYGGTKLNISGFIGRKVHLLGGHPARQRELGEILDVQSIDCNRLTLDAAFGDYFDGETFRPHPIGGYELCLADSITNINILWDGY